MCNINTLKQEELSAANTYEHNLIDETSVVDKHRCDMAAKFNVFVDEDRRKLLTFCWSPKLHKIPYKSRSIANSNLCNAIKLSLLLNPCLTAIKTCYKLL